MSLIIPDPRIEAPELFEPGRKPTGPMVLDSSTKFKLCLPFADPYARDIATNETGQLPQPDHQKWIWTPEGMVFQYVGPQREGGIRFAGYDRPLEWTVLTRIKLNNIGAVNAICSEYQWDGNRRGWQLQITSAGKMQWIASSSGLSQAANTLVGATTLVSDTFYDVAIAYKSSVVRVYLDGQTELTDDSNVSSIYSGAAPLLIGAQYNTDVTYGTDHTADVFNGTMAYFYIFSSYLSGPEIKSAHRNPYQFLIPA